MLAHAHRESEFLDIECGFRLRGFADDQRLLPASIRRQFLTART